MIDITHKITTHRKAMAEATVRVGSEKTIRLIRENQVPKGNVLESARVAALFAVKRTSDMIPDCHPMPVEYTGVTFEMGAMSVKILVEVQTVYKTGVEVEAMHGASVAALTLYDMLKPVDKQISIEQIRLIEKSGGKSDYRDETDETFLAAVIVCSDTISAGKKEDKAGKAIISGLEKHGVQLTAYDIIPDNTEQIQQKIKSYAAANTHFVLVCGGTGLSPRDITPEAVTPLFTREIPGIMEAARAYGQQRMPYAMFSRGVAGFVNNSLVVTLPGSTRGAEETMQALFPYLLHLFAVKKGTQHKEKK
ncbi:MAG: bifunctional molybdenum cofactor biosynthesis protein MoaC/MoaB [Bacteroidia bacterium]|nr:bifunctional molybdenum cofactor biosynthesis protein MoaC/MoaB [Bacteroidia bacterium]